MWHWDWALSYWEGQARKAVAKLICVMAGRQILFRSVVICLNKWMKRWREQLHFGPREMGVWHIESTQHEGVWFQNCPPEGWGRIFKERACLLGRKSWIVNVCICEWVRWSSLWQLKTGFSPSIPAFIWKNACAHQRQPGKMWVGECVGMKFVRLKDRLLACSCQSEIWLS